jgi:hypothetical protein
VVLSIEERVFLVEYVFHEGNRYTDLLKEQFAKSTVYHDRPHTLNELKTAMTAFIRKISQADLQKVIANKSKWVQDRTDARGHHCQHLL